MPWNVGCLGFMMESFGRSEGFRMHTSPDHVLRKFYCSRLLRGLEYLRLES